MSQPIQTSRILAAAIFAGSLLAAPCAPAAPSPPAQATTAKASKAGPANKPRALDRSGKKQRGKASFYARKFAGRTMADGTPMNPRGDNAASKTLPLGTVARVTNLETGQSAAVTIRDRGPYVPGRVVDLSPATARAIGITRDDGVAPVEVAPLSLPPPAPGGAQPPAGAVRK